MTTTGATPRGAPILIWIVKASLFVIATLGLAVLLVRLSYSTPLGRWVADVIPPALWQRYDAWYGPGDGESGQDGELFVFIGMALVAATIIVSCGAWLLTRLRRISRR